MSLADEILQIPKPPPRPNWIEKLDDQHPEVSKEIREIKERWRDNERPDLSRNVIYRALCKQFGDVMPSESSFNQWMNRDGDR